MPEPERLYHCPSLVRCERECLEEEYFLFNPASGETHLLNASAMWLLEHLSTEPASATMLTARLREREPADSGAELDQALRFQLQQLQILGLIEVWNEAERTR